MALLRNGNFQENETKNAKSNTEHSANLFDDEMFAFFAD